MFLKSAPRFPAPQNLSGSLTVKIKSAAEKITAGDDPGLKM
jgi:hypothetical protein